MSILLREYNDSMSVFLFVMCLCSQEYAHDLSCILVRDMLESLRFGQFIKGREVDNWDVLKWIGGTIAALVGGGLVFKWTGVRKSSKDSSTRIVVQSNNKAGGDIIAGDSVKNIK